MPETKLFLQVIELFRYRMLAGLLMTYLGRIPSISDHFEWAGFRFEVVDMDGHRVDKVLAAPWRQETAQQADSA